MDVINRLDSGLGQSPERTKCMVLFKICCNALFSLRVPVDLAFYLICPKHTSLICAAGCVRGSVSQPPLGGLQACKGASRGRHSEHDSATFTPDAPTHPRAPTLAYIFINTRGIKGGKAMKGKKIQQAEK